MKRVLVMFLAMVLIMSLGMSSAFAVDILPKDEEVEATEAPTEPLATPDPRAVSVGGDRTEFVENGEGEDKGTVWISWNGQGYAKYGCTTASINYTNPSASNIGVTLKVAIFDRDLITYFGTTFRPEEEINELAVKGYEALQNGINIAVATNLISQGYFEGYNEAGAATFDKEKLAEELSKVGFIGKTKEELINLTEEDVYEFDEVTKLTLAQLGGYSFAEFYMVIGEAGVVNPGYALYEVDLHTLPDKVAIPKGEYDAVFVLQGYDEEKNQLSDFFIHLPIVLNIEEDLPEELQVEYCITLAERIDN